MKKAGKRCVLFAFLLFLFILPTSAADQVSEEYEHALDTFLDAIPEEVRELLPDELFTGTTQGNEEALYAGSDIGSILYSIGRLTGLALTECLALLAKICGLLVLSSVLRSLSPDKSRGVGQALSLCSSLALSVLLLTLQQDRFAALETYFSTVKGLSSAFLPLMGLLYAMGGNVRAAAVNHSVLTAFLSILETLCAGSVLPVVGLCLALALLDAVAGGSISLRSLSALIKRTYTLCLSFLMLILCFVLGLQSTLAGAGDTLALRTARFAAGSFLPVVGGSVAETLRTVAGSVSYLRSVAGGTAILVLFFTLLPTLLSVLLTRITFLLGGAVAKLLRCDGEEKLLSELASVYGYFLAVISSLSVMLVFSLTLFARTASAGA